MSRVKLSLEAIVCFLSSASVVERVDWLLVVKGTEGGSSVSSAVVLSVSMAGVAGALCVSVLQIVLIVLRSCSMLVGKLLDFSVN